MTWKFPKVKSPDIEPKLQGSYDRNAQEMDLQPVLYTNSRVCSMRKKWTSRLHTLTTWKAGGLYLWALLSMHYWLL